MQARAISADVLSVRRWREHQERLLLVNFGETEWHEQSFGGEWRVLLDSGNPPQLDADGVTVAARSATVLAHDDAW